MSKNRMLRLALAVVNLIALLIVVLGVKSPLPVHFNFNMVCDRMGSKWILMILGGLALVLSFGDLLPGNGRGNAKPMSTVLTVLELLMVGLNWCMAGLMLSGAQLGDRVDLPYPGMICLLLGLALAAVANLTPRLKRNRLTGLRTSATLADDVSWKHAQRIGGQMGVIGGLIIAVGGVIGIVSGNNVVVAAALVLGILVAVLVPLIVMRTTRVKE